MLNWLSRFNIFCFLDDQDYHMPLNAQDCIAAAGCFSSIHSRYDHIQSAGEFIRRGNDWIFGHLGYGLKAETEGVPGGPADPIGFEPSFFFVPLYVIILRGTEIRIGSLRDDHQEILEDILRAEAPAVKPLPVRIEQKIPKEEYIQTIRQLQAHIRRGDCYEINFCQEFFAENTAIDAIRTFLDLSAVSPNPFSAFYRVDDRYLICASPERYIRKTGNKIVSQPIKGTITRNTSDPASDEKLREQLQQSAKERSENVMVVDLVRNDLSRVCKQGTVKVDELFGVYPFPQVHQMISTISGELDEGIGFEDIIRASFPMGSMTGAPKKKVLELIDKYERTGRGLFSGSVGYITPEKDFDLNVVIRSIFYNSKTGYLSYLVGSGITYYSDPEKEYEECLLKARAIEKVLGTRANDDL